MTQAKPTSIMFETSILFLGSGFSVGAKNIENTDLPTGGGLKDRFATIVGVSPTEYDLKPLADEIYDAARRINFSGTSQIFAASDKVILKTESRYTSNCSVCRDIKA